MKPTISELQPLFYKALGKKADITENTTRKDMPLWDSINHINLIMDIQDFYKVSFNTSDIQKIDSVKNLIEILEKKTA
ncbi:MAG TPA: acyl carrier protein [Bacteroidia bacterium]|nr:acyl carrier protein [Bacteroidia bacterium]